MGCFVLICILLVELLLVPAILLAAAAGGKDTPDPDPDPEDGPETDCPQNVPPSPDDEIHADALGPAISDTQSVKLQNQKHRGRDRSEIGALVIFWGFLAIGFVAIFRYILVTRKRSTATDIG